MKPTDNSFPAGNVTSLAERKAAKLAYFNREKYGSIIRAARLKKGINQPELARILNTSKNYVSNWEVGKARPDLNMIPGLCEALGISLNTFFGQAVFTEELTSEDRRVLSNYHYLSQQNRQVIDQLMATMLDVQARNLRKYVQENFQRVWYDDLKTSAGTGNPLDEGGHGVYIYLRADRNVCRADAVITVSGDSMEPDLHDGDDILVQYADAISPGERSSRNTSPTAFIPIIPSILFCILTTTTTFAASAGLSASYPSTPGPRKWSRRSWTTSSTRRRNGTKE